MSNRPVGEVIEAATTHFIAQCLEVPRQDIPKLYDPPPFGAFIKIGRPPVAAEARIEVEPRIELEEDDPFAAPQLDSSAATGENLGPAVYALVCAANTVSLEPNRRPSALGFEDEDEIRARQPQIFELLRTEFSGLLLAHSVGDGKGLRRYLPPTPPRIHSRVYGCDPAEVRALTADLGFLRSLLAPVGGPLTAVPADELVAACLRHAREAQFDDQGFLLRAGRTLATLLSDDYDRLQAILRNVI